MAITTKKEHEKILEVESLDKDIPSCSQYKCDETGYYLCSKRDQWVFPFFKKKIQLNIDNIYLPNHCFGLITDKYSNRLDYNVTTKRVAHCFDFTFIEIRSRRLLPFKIKKGREVALLSVIYSEECHTIIS